MGPGHETETELITNQSWTEAVEWSAKFPSDQEVLGSIAATTIFTNAGARRKEMRRMKRMENGDLQRWEQKRERAFVV